MKLCVVLSVLVGFVSAGNISLKASNPTFQLDDNNLFPVLVPGSGKFFIRFFTSLCEVCKAFTPVWHEVGEALSDDSKKFQVADLDCHTNKKSCDDLWVLSYPTFMWIDEGDIVHEIDEEMTKEECIDFASKELAKNSRKRREVEERFSGNIAQISSENFESTIATGVTIVLFGMHWCPHCQSELELLTAVQEDNSFKNVSFALVNCKTMLNVNLCFDELNNGIPTVNSYINKARIVQDFRGSSVNDYKRMIEAHVKGGVALKKWKKSEKIKDNEEY